MLPRPPPPSGKRGKRGCSLSPHRPRFPLLSPFLFFRPRTPARPSRAPRRCRMGGGGGGGGGRGGGGGGGGGEEACGGSQGSTRARACPPGVALQRSVSGLRGRDSSNPPPLASLLFSWQRPSSPCFIFPGPWPRELCVRARVRAYGGSRGVERDREKTLFHHPHPRCLPARLHPLPFRPPPPVFFHAPFFRPPPLPLLLPQPSHTAYKIVLQLCIARVAWRFMG